MLDVLTPSVWQTSTRSDATFVRPDLSTFCRLEELGLVVTG